MKKLLFILILLTACGEDPKPVYTSIEGKWKFSTKDISGEFEIVNYSGKLTVDNGSGNFFIISGKRFEIGAKQAITGTVPGPITAYLISLAPNSASISLRNMDVNKTYDQLTTVLYNYNSGGKDTAMTDKLVVTR